MLGCPSTGVGGDVGSPTLGRLSLAMLGDNVVPRPWFCCCPRGFWGCWEGLEPPPWLWVL